MHFQFARTTAGFFFLHCSRCMCLLFSSQARSSRGAKMFAERERSRFTRGSRARVIEQFQPGPIIISSRNKSMTRRHAGSRAAKFPAIKKRAVKNGPWFYKTRVTWAMRTVRRRRDDKTTRNQIRTAVESGFVKRTIVRWRHKMEKKEHSAYTHPCDSILLCRFLYRTKLRKIRADAR